MARPLGPVRLRRTNYFTLALGACLCLFIIYPVIIFVRDRARTVAIGSCILIHSIGQQTAFFQMSQLIDVHTSESAKTRTRFGGEDRT